MIYGEGSAFVLSREHGDNYAFGIFQKDTDGYVIPLFGSVDIVQSIGAIQIVQLKNTNDYYYYGFVKDSEGLAFLSDDRESYTLPSTLEGRVYCYGYLGSQWNPL